MAELPGVAQALASQSGSSNPPYAALAGELTAAVLAVTVAAWCTPRRWLR